jgi:hypothetical protein
VIHDHGDSVVPWSQGEALARAWPRARLLSTVGLGHGRILQSEIATRACGRLHRRQVAGGEPCSARAAGARAALLSMDTPRILILAGASIIGVLGTLHLVYTFSGGKLLPRDARVADAMKSTTMVITRETSLWDAWIGFNGSHSLGAMLFGALYLLLAARHMEFLARAPELLAVAIAALLAYLWLAHAYWFRIPFIGIAVAVACFAAAAALLYT